MVQFEINLFEMVFRGLIRNDEDNAILVGSRATGYYSERSDWDYLVIDWYKDAIITYLSINNIQYTSNTQNGNIKIVVDLNGFGSQILNVCFVPNKATYEAWIKATDVMRFLPPQCNIGKSNRIKMFCKLVKYFDGEVNNYENGES
jgi:hypothetical protein